MQKLFVTIAAVLSLVGCNVQNVDVAQPIAAADKFYSALKSGNDKTALAQFANEFKSQVDNWPRLLGGLQQKYGPVTAAELLDSNIGAIDEGPCYSLTYAIKRGSLASREILFLCSKGGNSPWLIRGHQITRIDTQQTITGGVTPTEASVHVP